MESGLRLLIIKISELKEERSKLGTLYVVDRISVGRVLNQLNEIVTEITFDYSDFDMRALLADLKEIRINLMKLKQ